MSQLQSLGYVDSMGNLTASHDAATAHLGAAWRMPTDAEFSALVNNCDTTWTSRGGMSGHLVRGRGMYASKSIFLPGTGYGHEFSLSDAGKSGYYPSGYYWSSTASLNSWDYAQGLYFYPSYFNRNFYCRCYGHPVRPVREFADSVIADAGGTVHIELDLTPPAYSITYVDTKGAANDNPTSYTVDDEVVFAPLSAPTGWKFLGWSPASIAKGTTGDKTVTAQWEQIKYAVDIDGVVDGTCVYGQSVTATTFTEKTEGLTNRVCLGWVGTGDVPASGTDHAVSFVVTQPSSLKWLYATNYWVSVTAGAGGSVTVKGADGASMSAETWLPSGTNMVCDVVADEGYRFVRWVDAETDVACGAAGVRALPVLVDRPQLLRAEFVKLEYVVTFDLGAHGSRTGGGALTQTVTWGDAAVAPTVKADTGYKFVKWSVAFDNVKSDLTVVAQWEATGGDTPVMPPVDPSPVDPTPVDPTPVDPTPVDPTPVDPTPVDPTPVDPTPVDPTPEKPNPGIVEEIVPAEADDFVATTYDGYLCDEELGVVVGTIQVKAAKPKKDKKSGKTVTALTITVQLADVSKKISVKGNYDLDLAEEQAFAVKNRGDLVLLLGSNGLTGSFESYVIEGVPNVYSARDAQSKAAASAADAAYVGSYNVIADEGLFAVTVAKKGKVKVTGTTAAGKSVSVSTQLIVGQNAACVPVIAPKVGLSFTVWLGAEPSVNGLSNAIIGPAGTLRSGACFTLDATELANLVGDATYAEYFPTSVSVSQSGTKWIVADGAKAGKVTLNKEKTGVDESKLGANPSALKLSYTAKTGAFKGSFKAYVSSNGKPKAVTVSVKGILVNGVGYGSATVKKVNIPVTIGFAE